MDENTVQGARPATDSIVVVVPGGINVCEAVTLALKNGSDGQRLLVFPSAELMTEWRERIAALA